MIFLFSEMRRWHGPSAYGSWWDERSWFAMTLHLHPPPAGHLTNTCARLVGKLFQSLDRKSSNASLGLSLVVYKGRWDFYLNKLGIWDSGLAQWLLERLAQNQNKLVSSPSEAERPLQKNELLASFLTPTALTSLRLRWSINQDGQVLE